MEEKEYKFGREVFTMPELTLGEMEEVQGLIGDNDIYKIETWASLLQGKSSLLLTLILKPKKSVDFWKKIKANDPALKEVLDDFFQKNSPLRFLSDAINSLGKGLKI